MERRILFSEFIEVEPVAKGRPRMSTISGKAYTPKTTWKYENHIRNMLVHNHGRQNTIPLRTPVFLSIHFFMPKVKSKKSIHHIGRPDLDNLLKAFMDAAEKVLWANDSQIVEIICSKHRADELVGIKYEVSVWG